MNDNTNNNRDDNMNNKHENKNHNKNDHTNDHKNKYDKIIDKRFAIIRKIGSGSFGKVYLAKQLSNNTYVAVKIEPVIMSKKDILKENVKSLPIYQEYSIYCITNQIDTLSVPRIYSFVRGKRKEITKKEITKNDELRRNKSSDSSMDSDTDSKLYKMNFYLVMQLVGPSIAMIRKKKDFTLIDIYNFGIQAIKILNQIHELGYVHRDLKPENFAYGLKQIDNNDPCPSDRVYLVDFGLSKKWKDEAKKYENNNGKNLGSIVGTARYMSIGVQSMYPYTRHDDLESLSYILIYLHRGYLPWQGMKNKDNKHKKDAEKRREDMKLIKNKKIECKSTLCKGLPNTLRDIMQYCWNAKPLQSPKYEYLKTLLKKGIIDETNKKDHEKKKLRLETDSDSSTIQN